MGIRGGHRHGLAAALLLAALPAHAQELPPQFGRYMPLYPGLYFHAAYAQDDRDAAFDGGGEERDSAAPQAGGQTAFPEKSLVASFQWHFPMFESYGLPFFSDRTHTARLTLRHVDTHTEGRLAAFVADDGDDARSEADDLKNDGHGVGDLTLEFGSFLYGARDWRTRQRTPLAVLLLGSVNVPTGVYDRDAPNNAGSNTWYFQGKLGVHWQPWAGALVDAGYAHRDYTNNEEPAFGATAPHKQGDDRLLDVSFAQRLWRDAYAGIAYAQREGDASEYRQPQFAANAPPHPDDNTDAFPRPGVYRDEGTELRTLGVSLHYFLTQRWLAALHWQHPLEGRSGEFDLPYDQKSPSGCIPGSTGCSVSEYETVRVDGMGAARVYASDRLMLTLTHNFGLGDAFTCTGCKR